MFLIYYLINLLSNLLINPLRDQHSEVYEDLYNSSGSSEAMEALKGQINDMIDESETSEYEIGKVT